MDIKKLSKVCDAKVSDPADSRKRISDALNRRKEIKDAELKRQSFVRKLKDDLEDTESTDEAIEVAIDALQEQEPEQVIATVITILGETMDKLIDAEPDGDSDDIDDGEIEDSKHKGKINAMLQRKTHKVKDASKKEGRTAFNFSYWSSLESYEKDFDEGLGGETVPGNVKLAAEEEAKKHKSYDETPYIYILKANGKSKTDLFDVDHEFIAGGFEQWVSSITVDGEKYFVWEQGE